MSDEVVYTSQIQVERIKGPVRKAYLPLDESVFFGTHSEIAAYYKHDPAIHEPHSTTLDYVVAATAG
jgi:hypothetical protein